MWVGNANFKNHKPVVLFLKLSKLHVKLDSSWSFKFKTYLYHYVLTFIHSLANSAIISYSIL